MWKVFCVENVRVLVLAFKLVFSRPVNWNSVAWYCKLRNEYAPFLQEHYWYYLASYFMLQVYQVLFFNATHQVKAIAIGISKDNPLVEIGSLL